MLQWTKIVFQISLFLIIATTEAKKQGPIAGTRGSSESLTGKKSNSALHEAGHPSGDNSKRNKDDAPLNELIETIFGAYHKELVPKRPTTVRLDLLLIKVKSTNEREGIFESVVALLMEWQDKRLVWNPSQYGNVTVLAFDSDKVWLPDIAMVNSADHLYSISKDTRFVVRVSNDGSMKFVPTGTARTWCDLKLLTFPFDKQTCSYEFESWSMDSSTMTLNVTSSAVVDESFSSPQWELCDHSSIVYDHHYEFSGEVFTRLRFDFVVRRKTTFYLINLIFPCATLSMIQLMVFIIPSTDSTSDRISFGTTNLLTLVVFQTIITEEMPKSSDSVTALSKYIISLIVMSAVGILEAVAAERLLRPRCTPPPRWLMKVAKFPLLWEAQLPSGISGMLLQLWSAGKYLPMDTEKEKDRRRKRTAHLRKAAFSPFAKKNRRIAFSSSPSAENSGRQTCCFCKKSNFFKRLVCKMSARQKKSNEVKSADFYRYEGTMRHSPSPIFGATTGTLKFEPIPYDSSPKCRFRLGSVNESVASSVKSTEADIIQIGKMWGALVTRLDGLTFVVCALCVFFLPVLFFLPVALDGEVCV